MTDSGQRKTTLGTKLAYGLGSVAFGVKDGGFTALLLIFYNQVLGVRADLVGLAIMIALFVDAFIDPLIGRLSDQTRSRWGRRHPFMYAAAIPCAVTYYLLWNPPVGLGHDQLFAYLLVVAILVRVSVALYEIPSASLAAELTSDYDQRTSLVAYRYFFAWAGGIGMGVLAFSVFLKTSGSAGLLVRSGYSHYAIAASAVMLASILISAMGTHRGIAGHMQPPPRRPFDLARDLREMGAAFANRSFLAVLAAGLLAAMVAGLTTSLNVYFAAYFWGMSSAQISALILCSLLAATLALVLGPILSRVLEKKTAAILVSLASLVVAPAPIVLRLLGWFPENGTAALLPVLFLFAIASITLQVMAGIICTSMMIDTIEDNELKTGRRTEGLYFAAAFFTQKFVSGFGVLAAGLLLSAVHFPTAATPGQVDPAILRHLALIYLPTVAVVYALSIACLAGYRISRASHQADLEKLGRA